MTTSAWIMLVVTWTIVLYFTTRFLWMVLTKPVSSAPDEED